MDLSSIGTLAELNAFIATRSYRQTPSQAQGIIDCYARLFPRSCHVLGDYTFWREAYPEFCDSDDESPATDSGGDDDDDDAPCDVDSDAPYSPGTWSPTDVQTGGVVVAAVNGGEFFRIVEVGERHSHRFQTVAKVFQLQLFPENMNHLDDLYEAFGALIETAFSGAPLNALLGFEMNHPDLQYPILIPFTRREYMSAARVLDVIEKVR